MVADEFSCTGLFVAVEMVTTAEPLLGTVPGVQFPAVNQRSLTVPVHVWADAGAPEKHANARTPIAKGIQREVLELCLVSKEIVFMSPPPNRSSAAVRTGTAN
jgi:hypothetical protein